MTNYYKQKPSVIVQRYKFNTRMRQQGELVAAYVAALRELAEHCTYGASLLEMLRGPSTYNSAYQLAQSIEMAERDSKRKRTCVDCGNGEKLLNFTKPTKPAKPHKPHDSATLSQGQITCYRCGGPHLATKCKWKDLECRCGGHPLPNIDFVLCMFCRSLPVGSTCCHSVRINVMKFWY